ncbi:unnamed protein product [Dovyalis caffra]|uniref:AP2/ERF domain-containing protein n=1 Tax=Dovyalis caffra TaxID=77055 RepID=A0AAV1QN76_9ROSI|nr:unnamed protein product [Dovyalis caffra]
MNNIESSKLNPSQDPCNHQANPIPLETTNTFENGEKGVISRQTKTGKISNGPRYLGVRQRPSGRWVAEIKDSSQKLRLWLGTYDRAEEAALAYDSAARLLRGRNAKTNFSYHGIINSHEENCSLVGKNPRLYHLLQHAIMKNHARSAPLRIPYNHDLIDFETLVEDTIVCSSASDDHGFRSHEFDARDGYSKLCGLSYGTSKVYSSVIVAPSFSASLCQEGEQNNWTKIDKGEANPEVTEGAPGRISNRRLLPHLRVKPTTLTSSPSGYGGCPVYVITGFSEGIVPA